MINALGENDTRVAQSRDNPAGFLEIIRRGNIRWQVGNDEANAMLAQFRKALLFDDQGDYLKEIIEAVISSIKQRKLITALMDKTNLISYVIDKIATLYTAKEPVRSFKGPTETQKQLLSKIYQDAEFNERMGTLNRYLMLLNDCALLIQYDPELDIIIPEILDRENCRVISHDRYPNRIIQLEYNSQVRDDTGALMDVVIVYTKTEHYMVYGTIFDDRKDEEKMPVPGASDIVNPLGVIPAVAIHSEYNPHLFWNPTKGNDLFTAALQLSFFLSLKNYNILMGDMKVQFILGAMAGHNAAGKTDSIELAPGEVVCVPTLTGTSASMETVDFTTNAANRWNDIKMSFVLTMRKYGLDAADIELIETRNPEAGVSMTIRKSGETAARLKFSPIFQKFEVSAFNMIRTVWNYYHDGAANQIPEAATVSVIFPTMEFFANAKEERDTLKQRVDDGVMSPGAFYIHYNPETKTEEEAVEKMRKNLETLRKISGTPEYLMKSEALPGVKYEEGADSE